MISVAVIFHRLGPYHHARLRAASRVLDLTAIELSGQDNTYAWEKIGDSRSFNYLTLFQQSDSDEESSQEIMKRLSKALSDLSPDVVAVPGWSNKGALAALLLCNKFSIPVIVMSASTAEDFTRRLLKEYVKSRVIRFCSAGLVGGKPHSDYLQFLGMNNDRVLVGYDVVDNDHFAIGANIARSDSHSLRKKYELPQRYFIACGRFIRKKNFSLLFKAYRRYRSSADKNYWGLVILGDGPLKQDLIDLAIRLDLTNDVLFPGFIQYDHLPTYYGLAGAFVHTSTTEQWGLVINEAMASGLPVIVSNRCGCVPDLVDNGRNGFTFDPCNKKELAACMHEIASNTNRNAVMGRESQKIIEYWSPEIFSKNLKKAVQVAIENQLLKVTVFDKLLLNILVRW